MKTRTKYILLFVLLAAALLVIVVGGKLYAAVRDPLHAFENGRTAEPGGEAALLTPEPAPAQEPSATGTPGPTAAPTPTPDPAAVLNIAQHPDEAAAFLDYLSTDAAAAVFQSVGFTVLP